MESEQTVKGLGSSNLPLSGVAGVARTVLGALLLGSVLAHSQPAAADATGSVAGRILDARSGKPLSGASVGAYSPGGASVARSRADGTFSIVGLATGRTVVTLEATGYESAQCAYRLLPGGEARLTFALRPSSRLAGARTGADEERRSSCPRAPIGGGEIQDVYVIGE